MSNISLSMRPHVTPVGWEEFCATHGPYTIGLDGYAASGSGFDPAGPRLNLDPHTEVDRLATRATCGQTLLAIRQGLFECFRDGNGARAEVCVNDCDEDVCTSWFLLAHPDLAFPGKCPPLNRLVGVVDMLDTTAGAYPLPPDLGFLKELAWVFAPYHSFRTSGELDRRQPEKRSLVRSPNGGQEDDLFPQPDRRPPRRCGGARQGRVSEGSGRNRAA